jgi:hypothetical protein
MAMSLFPMLIRLSQLRNKDEILKQFQESLQQQQPEQPGISLSVQWDKLNPIEKSALARSAGHEQLAQANEQIGGGSV